MTTFFTACGNYPFTVGSTHTSAKTRLSFLFAVGSAQSALSHYLYPQLIYSKLLDEVNVNPVILRQSTVYKKPQSLILLVRAIRGKYSLKLRIDTQYPSSYSFGDRSINSRNDLSIKIICSNIGIFRIG